MKFNSFSALSEDDKELHLPELVYCSSLGDLKQVEHLLDQGIDPNQTDEDGYSALHAAAENNHLEVVKLLISRGANTHYKAAYTALQLAEMAHHQDIIAYLKSL